MRMQDRTVCDVLVLQFKIVQYVMQPIMKGVFCDSGFDAERKFESYLSN